MTETTSTITKVQNRDELFDRLLDLEDAIRKEGVVSLSLFGSAVRDELEPESDIDILINEYRKGFSYFDIAGIGAMIEEACGRRAHVALRAGLKPAFRDEIIGEAVEIF